MRRELTTCSPSAGAPGWIFWQSGTRHGARRGAGHRPRAAPATRWATRSSSSLPRHGRQRAAGGLGPRAGGDHPDGAHGFAALALGVVFLRRPMIADWRRPGAAWRLVVMIAMSSLTLLLFFYAVLHTSVAIAMFLLFLMPLWVALIAPRVFHSPREPIVWPALGLALTGPGRDPRPRSARRQCRAHAGRSAGCAVHGLRLRLVHDLGEGAPRRIVASSTISMAGRPATRCSWRRWPSGSSTARLPARRARLDRRRGDGRSPVRRSLTRSGSRARAACASRQVTILGYVEPVAGPLYAVFLVGQMPSVWTVLGGALILGAGLLVIVFRPRRRRSLRRRGLRAGAALTTDVSDGRRATGGHGRLRRARWWWQKHRASGRGVGKPGPARRGRSR